MQFYIALGGKRYTQYQVSTESEAYFRFLQTIGKHNSDVHTAGVSIRKFRKNAYIISFDMDKLHAGSPGEWSCLNICTHTPDTCTCPKMWNVPHPRWGMCRIVDGVAKPVMSRTHHARMAREQGFCVVQEHTQAGSKAAK